MRVLFTGFKGVHNTSFQLVGHLGDDRMFLTNSFQGLKKDIASIDTDYDIVYMFGVDKTLRGSVRIEACARLNGEQIYTDFDISSLQNKLREHGINCVVSHAPTGYLCNFAYYYMLHRNANTVFIHIPSIAGMEEDLMKALIGAFNRHIVNV